MEGKADDYTRPWAVPPKQKVKFNLKSVFIDQASDSNGERRGREGYPNFNSTIPIVDTYCGTYFQ
jgi:hypothetical protein